MYFQRIDQERSDRMFLFYLLLGIAVITFGIYVIRNPYSWWFKKISDDREPSDLRIYN